jgi:hypothetical protein
MNGPDFLCIGMQKAGTSWLFDQLQYHPDFWMPPVKELHYFDKVFPEKKLAREIVRAGRSLTELEAIRFHKNLRPLDQRDLDFFEDVEACRGRGAEMPMYIRMFRHKGDLISGDITPALGTLAEERVREITSGLPQARYFLMLRDPIERVWSQVSMSYRNEEFSKHQLEDPNEFRAFLKSRSVEVRSFPTRIFRTWARYVEEARLKAFFFAEADEPVEKLRSDIISFLGGSPDKKSGKLDANYNRKSDLEKLEMTEQSKQILIDHFTTEIRECASLFGGPARGWLAKYGI